MDKRKTGNALGISSILLAVMSVIIFLVIRGPHMNLAYFSIVSGIFSIIGVLFAVFSWVMSKRIVYPIIGFIGNGLVLVAAFFLLIAAGISGP